MQTKTLTAALVKAGLAASVLLLASGASLAQQQVNLTAQPASLTTPDGNIVQMWGYSCGTAAAGSTATCASLNPAAGSGWSPVVITVPTGQTLQINLTNNLSFANSNSVPTSLTIVGQVGGGLGSPPTTTAPPTHSQLGVTWSTVAPAGTGAPGGGATFTPPTQDPRVQSFATEVAAGATTALTWTTPRPGTYLLESGTHPSIQGPMGLYGIVVVTNAPTSTTGNGSPSTETAPGTAYPGVPYDADVPMLLSEIDPIQNNAVSAAVNTAGFSETMVWSGQPGSCGNPGSTTYNQCYPPAVNYTPLYYMINGVAFDKTNSANSLFPVTPTVMREPGGKVLVRLVNAGLRMHVPSIVGSLTGDPAAAPAIPLVSGFALVAEDGNLLPPGAPRVQSEVFMSAGKTYDVMITQPSGVSAVVVTNSGNGYGPTFDPTTTQVSLVGGGGTGAMATPNVTYSVATVGVTSGGAGYSLTDSAVTFSGGGGGSGASATATLNFSVSNNFTITSGGSCYSPSDQLVFTGGGGGAGAAAAVTTTDNSCPTNGTTTTNAGAITGITLTSAGSGYTSVPTVTVNTTTGDGTAVIGTALSGTVTAVTVTSAGSGYASAPTATVNTSTATTPAQLAVLLDPTTGKVTSIQVVARGSGYTSAPNVVINSTAATGATAPASATAYVDPTGTLPVFDRQLSLSGNAIQRDAGMLAYISINGGRLPSASTFVAATANPDTYNSVIAGHTLTVSDPGKGVLANDINVYGVQVTAPPTKGNLTLNTNGTFTYVASTTFTGTDMFTYCGNGMTSGPACATVTLGAAPLEAAASITVVNDAYSSNAGAIATAAAVLNVKPPGVLVNDSDAAGYPLKVAMPTAGAPSTVLPLTPLAGATGTGTVTLYADGSFQASVTGAGSYTFTYQAQNSQGSVSPSSATVTLNFPQASNLQVSVQDPVCYNAQIASGATPPAAKLACAISDYRWVIEEDRTFYIDPTTTTNTGSAIIPTLGVNFHTSNMPFVAQGCTGTLSCEGGQMIVDTTPGSPTFGQHVNAVCDIGNGVCRPDPTGQGLAQILPGQVYLDPTKRYYISVLPGDAANPFQAGYTGVPCTAPNTPAGCSIGHGMGGAPIGIDPNTKLQASSVTIMSQPSPYPPAKLSVFVFEDDFPLNGEQDGGGSVDVLGSQEPGLGGFQIHLWDAMGGNGDFTGQMTYDMFNQPLTNSLDGTTDPNTGLNACPITAQGLNSSNGTAATDSKGNALGGITGMIVTCPKYEGDGKTLSPLAGQAVVANLMPGRFGVVATPSADRIARGEEWLQTNTLDGQKAHDSFVRIGEPSFFQEFGPAGYHVSIGFANPAIINSRHDAVCDGSDATITGTNCTFTIKGRVVGEHLSRTPDERLYGTGSHDAFAWSQCFASFGDPDGEDFAFTKCDADGNFTLANVPTGDWRLTTFDQWNDQLVDGLSTPVRVGTITQKFCPGPATSATAGICDLGDIAATQWQANLYTRTFIDDNQDGASQATEAGIPFANVAVRLRDGSLENLLVTDFTGTANFNETFPLFSWYTVETDVTRYKNTGTHVVYDVGGPVDGSLTTCGGTAPGAGYPPCSNSTIGKHLANTAEIVSVPTNLRVPGAVYCAGADCTNKSIQNGPASSDPPSICSTTNGATTCTTQLSSGRIDPPWAGAVEGWQGFPGQNNFIEFGKEPYVAGENGGIKGHVIYASTRPFDDPQMLVQTQWEPLVPHVTINLYQEGFGADGTPTLTLVDTTQTSSWDDYAQGFHADANGNPVPNMNCPGQGAANGPLADLFFFSLYNQPDYLDAYNAQHGGTAAHALPYNSQFKCYDGMHNWNQLQPAPYDGMYQFPSVTAWDPTTGKPAGTNCKICTPNPVSAPDLYSGLPMLPVGKYVVEVVVPAGFELVKEEDKNILIGDQFIAPATQQFGGLGNVFIMPDQASVATAYTSSGVGYNANNAQNPTQSFGASPQNGIVPGFIPEPIWPCVGALRTVPDYISLYPQTKQVSPFAGASRHLCDRKEVTLDDQAGAIAKFFVYTSAHIASKFTGGITDDYTSEFDPFSPQFGEKFAPPNLPVAVRDWAGNETNRVYADHWGAYNGMTYSTWEVNPPNPTGYSPTMMVFCMNDQGPITDTRMTILNSSGIAVPNPTFGQQITDPQFTQGYSQFCYELPFMPGTTQYLDTPVVPTSAFAGAGYNNVDCAYPNATPAVKEVDGDGVGPWVSSSGNTLTITALGDQTVPNNAYSGPSATTAPYNQKTILRHYGFGGSQGTGSVTIGGITANVTNWSDTVITVQVPNGVPSCPIQQQAQYGGSPAQCGELIITAANGQKSVDAVTVTIGGKPPTRVASNNPLTPYAPGSIQQAIDAASPGDLIIVPPGTYYEMLLMWKPVRLQGVGAASSIINAQTQPAGKMDQWRRQVDCLFALSLNGQPIGLANPVNNGSNPYDPAGQYSCPGNNWKYFVGSTASNPQVDRQPLEATLGWNASLNGNMAELLQEPSLMGALEGAGITVLSKGVDFHGANPNDPSLLAGFPVGTTLLTNANCESGPNGSNLFPSNFQCNPSSIDGLGVTESSQGGGGIFVHAWGHNLQIANNRVHSNAGTLSGGINVGQGEFPPAYIQGSATNAAPGSCETSLVNNVQLPYCHNLNVNVHNNYVALNSSTGDELFSATPAGAGGVSFCTGADYYLFNYNWVCGNLSSGDGGGFGHMGFSKNGDIEHNTFVFNQSVNPTIPANGGGLVIMGSPDADPATCGVTTDSDCVPNPASIGPSDGVGPGLKINANLIMGNAAESGTGGGVAFQNVNGSDVVAFPKNPGQWHHILFTNNIVVDNVAGWDGAGVSLLDALNVDLVNNTIAANVTTASAGVLFNTLGGPLASQQGPTCTKNCGTISSPQPAGLVSLPNSSVLEANLPKPSAATPVAVVCPMAHYTGSPNNGVCTSYSYPLMANNVFWQNTAFDIGVQPFSAQYQQAVVTLLNAFSGTTASSQASTGACDPGRSFWDIGVRGDTGPGNHASGVSLAPIWSVLTNTGTTSENGAGNNNLLGSNPRFFSQYCDGSRQPPESGISGWQTPAGISDATVPNPVFDLTPVATVDEGNNWVNMRWGPLTMVNPVNGTVLGNYALENGSPAIDRIGFLSAGYIWALLEAPTDYFGNVRPDGGNLDVGAIQSSDSQASNLPQVTSVNPPTGLRGTTIQVAVNGTNLDGATALAVSGGGITIKITGVSPTAVTAQFVIASNAAVGARNVTVTTPQGANTLTGGFTVQGPTLTSIDRVNGLRGSSFPVTLTGTNLSGATAVTVSGGGVTAAATSSTATSVTTTFTITTTAALSARTVAVVTPIGTTGTVPFTVQGATLTSISQTSGVRGTSVPVTLTGTFLNGATAVTVSGTGVTAAVTSSTNTTVGATLTMASGAAPGARTVSVTTPAGVTNTVAFTVTGATVAISAPTPALTTTTGNTTTKTGTITVSNTATGATAGPLTLTAAPTITKTAGAGAFSITGGTCASGTVVNPGSSCTITVQYVPSGTANSTAHVALTDTGAATGTQNGGNFNGN